MTTSKRTNRSNRTNRSGRSSRTQRTESVAATTNQDGDPGLWERLVRQYAEIPIEASGLKIATLAQWALESGFATSDLAKDHNNFGGLKFRARVNRGREGDPLATPVDYEAHDGEDTYCAFGSIEDFIEGYWSFIDNGAMYEGWRRYEDDPSGYIGHLHAGGYATDSDYIGKVLNAIPRVRRQVMDMGLSEAFDEDLEPGNRTPVAILIGHNSHARGAYSDHLDVSEWNYNQRVFDEMKAREGEFGVELRRFFRERNPNGYSAEIAAAYAEIEAWGPAAILELHFNAGGGTGTEMLHWHTSDRGEILASAVQEAVVEELGLRTRGLKPRRRGDRGGTSLVAASAPTILTEPFFGDSAIDCTRMLDVGHAGLARAYLIGIRDALERF
ncbi:MAG: glucosaminidase domain-containing protein [Pseudomonadota bacterium]